MFDSNSKSLPFYKFYLEVWDLIEEQTGIDMDNKPEFLMAATSAMATRILKEQYNAEYSATGIVFHSEKDMTLFLLKYS